MHENLALPQPIKKERSACRKSSAEKTKTPEISQPKEKNPCDALIKPKPEAVGRSPKWMDGWIGKKENPSEGRKAGNKGLREKPK